MQKMVKFITILKCKHYFAKNAFIQLLLRHHLNHSFTSFFLVIAEFTPDLTLIIKQQFNSHQNDFEKEGLIESDHSGRFRVSVVLHSRCFKHFKQHAFNGL